MHQAHMQRTSDGLIRGVATALVPSVLAWSAIIVAVKHII